MDAKIETLLANAARMRKTALPAALAIELVAGVKARALCCWCAERLAPDAKVHRLPLGGDCEACSVRGHDVLVVWGEVQ